MRSPVLIDLFSGCGGLSQGFSAAGFRPILGIDIDKTALVTYQQNHRDSEIIDRDIGKIEAGEIKKKIGHEEVDVIVGGPPCQGMSLSGPRRVDDERNRLFLSFVKLAGAIRPTAVVLENVPGMVSLFEGRIKNEVVEKFNSIGYSMSVGALLAADYGVPQLRKRVFFVGIRDESETFSFPEKTHFRNPTICEGDRPYVTCEDALSDLPPLDEDIGSERQEYISPPRNEYQTLMRGRAKYIYNHIAADHSDFVKKVVSLIPEGGNYKDLPAEYINSRNFHVAWTRFHSKKPAPTIDTGHRHHFHYRYNRVPTVRENARLQSFPDKFVFHGNKTQQFTQVGNAVPPLLAQAIAIKLKKQI